MIISEKGGEGNLVRSSHGQYTAAQDLVEVHMLFVPPCGLSFEENERLRPSYCPAGRKIRSDARYLGIYAGKTVRSIGEIKRIVVCNVDVTARRVVVNEGDSPLSREEQTRILQATVEARNRRWDISAGHRFFLCDRLEETDFRKLSPQGIRNRRYFDLRDVFGHEPPEDLASISALLRNHIWQ